MFVSNTDRRENKLQTVLTNTVQDDVGYQAPAVKPGFGADYRCASTYSLSTASMRVCHPLPVLLK